MTKQKRGQDRYIKRCIAEFDTEKGAVKGIVRDFSKDGLFMRTTNIVDEGSVIDLRIVLPDERVLLVKGEVMRSEKASTRWYAGRKLKLSSGKEGMGIRIIERNESYINFVASLT